MSAWLALSQPVCVHLNVASSESPFLTTEAILEASLTRPMSLNPALFSS